LQIHIYVTPQFWQELLEATDKWPEEHRNQVYICRYALAEVLSEISQGYEVPSTPAPSGTMHVQCRASSAEEEEWTYLREHYGSGAAALRVALAFLHDSLTEEQEEVEEDPWAPFKSMSEEDLLNQSTDDLRKYARYLGILSPSKIVGGKGVLVQRILGVRG
jgi:cyclopropane fatty-acyl-phospholipid synthase-like methyltransferase